MNIEWWMIDGGVCLIVLAAAIIGAARGIGDTIIRIAAVAGGGALAFMYSDKAAEYLNGTSVRKTLHDHIFGILGGSDAAAGGEEMSTLPDTMAGNDTSLTGQLSRSLSGLFNDAADRAADAAADRLTEIAIGIIAFASIILTVVVATALIKSLIRHLRTSSVVLGFTDRLLGFVLGAIRGLLLAWIAVALLIPVTTIVSPESVEPMMKALHQTTVAQVIYEVNPLLYVVKLVLRS